MVNQSSVLVSSQLKAQVFSIFYKNSEIFEERFRAENFSGTDEKASILIDSFQKLMRPLSLTI